MDAMRCEQELGPLGLTLHLSSAKSAGPRGQRCVIPRALLLTRHKHTTTMSTEHKYDQCSIM